MLSSLPGARSTSWLTRFLMRNAGAAPASFESLEARQMLTVAPLPHISDLESPNDTVVRLETNFGDIDIELYNGAAPITVANFLNYVTSGRFDESFFHRSALNPNPFVLQGGGFKFDNTTGLTKIATDDPIVRETTGKSNLARTIAMARTNDINSATDQFFINYVDNTFLDPTSSADGYAVFGKVVQGWDVVTTIEGLQSLDLTSSPAFAGTDSSAFGEVPVTSSFNSSVGPKEETLVTLLNAEIIKPAATAGFFSQKVFESEGFRSGTSVENLKLVNPNGITASYQVIAHYETGIRDTVIASGTLNANTSLSITLSDFNQSSLNTIRSGTPYSLEVDTALPETFAAPKPIAAAINRVDFNADESESFYNPAADTAANAARTWDFPRIERNSQSQEFITYFNTSDTTATVTTTFTDSAGATTTVVRTLEPYRRGGLEVWDLNLPAGAYSAHVTSTQDIVAMLSDWDLPNSGVAASAAYTPGWGVEGVTDGGSTTGGFGGAEIQDNWTSIVSFFNPGATAATVTLDYWRTSRTQGAAPGTQSISVPAGGRTDVTLDTTNTGTTAGESFTITYNSNTPVSGQYTSFDSVGRNTAAGKHADGVSTAFSGGAAPISYFADGQMDPTRNNTTQTETLSLFNPFSNSAVTFNYTVRFIFSDGTTLDGATGTLAPNARIDINTLTLASIRNKAGTNFRNYTIAVLGTATNGPTTTNVAPLASLTRIDTTTGRAISTEGMPSAPLTPLNDASFS